MFLAYCLYTNSKIKKKNESILALKIYTACYSRVK